MNWPRCWPRPETTSEDLRRSAAAALVRLGLNRGAGPEARGSACHSRRAERGTPDAGRLGSGTRPGRPARPRCGKTATLTTASRLEPAAGSFLKMVWSGSSARVQPHSRSGSASASAPDWLHGALAQSAVAGSHECPGVAPQTRGAAPHSYHTEARLHALRLRVTRPGGRNGAGAVTACGGGAVHRTLASLVRTYLFLDAKDFE